MGRKKTRPKGADPVARQFGDHLNDLLHQRGLSVPDYAEKLTRLGCKKSAVAVWEIIRGVSTPPMKHLRPMSRALGLKHWQEIIPPIK